MRTMPLLLFVLLLPIVSFAQSEYLEGNQSGFGLAADFAFHPDGSSHLFSLAYSWKSIFDVGVGIGNAQVRWYTQDARYFGATAWILRETRGRKPQEITGGNPLSLGISGGYMVYPGESYTNWTIVAVLAKRLMLKPSHSFLQPVVAVGRANASGHYGAGNSWIYSGGMSLCLALGSEVRLFVYPNYVKTSSNDGVGGIDAGFVVALGP